jgi:hypothetical protein
MSCVRRVLLAGSAGLVLLIFAGAAQAKSRIASHQLCVPVYATGVGQNLARGVAEATISSHGVVLGTTYSRLTPTLVGPPVDLFTGPIVFSSEIGTLTVQVNAAFYFPPGTFTETSTSVTGTGSLSAVSGQLTIKGTFFYPPNEPNSTFTETITGKLCVG